MLRRAGLGHHLAGLRVEARPLEDDPAVEPGEVLGVGQPDVDHGDAARREVVGERLERRPLRAARLEHQERVEGDEREAVSARVGQPQTDEVGLDERRGVPSTSPPGGRRAAAGAVEHRRVEVDAGDPVAGRGERDGQPAGPDRELEDRAAGPLGEREVQVEVARVVDEVEVVQPREGGGGPGSRASSIGSVVSPGARAARTGRRESAGGQPGLPSGPAGRPCAGRRGR